MIKEKLAEVLKERIRISVETQDNWDYGIERCWKEEIELLSHNINDTIAFFGNDCTAKEFSWLSEVFEQVAKKTHSKEFVAALRKTADKYPEETKQYNILDFIESAECIVNSKQDEES